ncbi:MAG: hypothetical protein QQN63_05185 [Nitrosopumilus sp.]
MAATTEMLTTVEVIDLGLAQGSFDEELIEDFIILAQRHYVRDFLGKDFYNEILDQIEGATLTADNTALLDDYLKPMLANYVVYDSLPQIRNNITSAGVMNNSSTTSEASSSTDFALLRNNILQLAQRWEKDAKQFIIDEQDDDSTKYPLFGDCVNNQHRGKNQIIIY